MSTTFACSVAAKPMSMKLPAANYALEPGSYVQFQGLMATPHVAGLVALVRCRSTVVSMPKKLCRRS